MPQTRATKNPPPLASSSGSQHASDKFEAFDWLGQNRSVVQGVSRIQAYRIHPSRWTQLTRKPSPSPPRRPPSSSPNNNAMDVDTPTRMVTRSMARKGGACDGANAQGAKRSSPSPAASPRPARRRRTTASDKSPADSSDIIPAAALPILQLPSNLKGNDVFCLHCGHTPSSSKCSIDCYRTFRNTHFVPAESKIHIRHTAPGAHHTGLGVYVNAGSSGFHEGDYLGEYLGELLPLGAPEVMQSDYIFTLDAVTRKTRGKRGARHDVAPEVYVDAAQHGNWTRFVNSSCTPNVEALARQAGRVRMVVYRAVRAIRPGEQLFVYYGKGYFTSRGLRCLCPADTKPHMPPEDEIQVP
ncbi:hypothetical protein VTJ83DRAFT_6050 [Remersonia thermophila]|uniref:SET domain-containing protein n=1 Tax=Remersonia thermophila TaxID=72144 RepID=A0ABR4D8Q0_9PEZI